MDSKTIKLNGKSLSLQVTLLNNDVNINVVDIRSGQVIADGPYYYRAAVSCPEGLLIHNGLRHVSCKQEEDIVTIEGYLAGLRLQHRLELSSGKTYLEESIHFVNETDDKVKLERLEMGFRRKITDCLKIDPTPIAIVAPELRSDRLSALPLKHRVNNPKDFDNSHTFLDLMKTVGGEQRSVFSSHDYFPSLHRSSEGWVWEYANGDSLGIYTYDQKHIHFCTLATEPEEDDTFLRFGGAMIIDKEPAALTRIAPGEAVDLGFTRLQTISGGYHQAAYAFRDLLDEMGCRFPAGFNPPVHWNELYDNPEWVVQTPGKPTEKRPSRSLTYSRELIETEAEKAAQYHAESLYLDPGWDTYLGSLAWGEEWLGSRSSFIKHIHSKYGLQVSLHCPLAPWVSEGAHTFPKEAMRMDKNGNIIEGSICLGSQQYLDVATQRLLGHCEDGVVFFMFDGNAWVGGCYNPNHGHPVPYMKSDNCVANMQLTTRIKEQYPQVLIEMHDMVIAGVRARYTPVYLGYAQENSFDSNWAFELMWQPMEDILAGRSRALYYYNLACNIPLYLHIDLRDDNEYNLAFWWCASTCRHLGIGGVHRNPLIAEAHKKSMEVYRRLKQFYTEGDFFGSEENPEEVHLHVLKDRNAVLINLFNLSAESKMLIGSIDVKQLGIDPDQWYFSPQPFAHINGGRVSWNRRLPAFGTDVLEIWPASSLTEN